MSDLTGSDVSGPGFDDHSSLSAYLDGELTADERLEVEARLAESAEWRDELDEVRGARDAVRDLSTRDAPHGFWESVTATVAATPEDIGPEDIGPERISPEDIASDGIIPEDTEHAPIVPMAPARSVGTRAGALVAWIAGAAAAVIALGALFVIPGRKDVHPNVVAVATQHGAANAQNGDPISGLVPLGPLGGSR